MSNNSGNRKISQFLSATSVPSGARFTYISSGTNYSILDSDFYLSLGVTGTIVQKGDPLGTPILNTAGAVNEIRNVEDGPAIKSSVSAQGGITLEHNFQADVVGAQLVDDLTLASPTFRSLVAGAGMSVSQSGEQIQIAISGTPVSTKTVVVNSISDFPAAVAGVITLADNTEYAIRNDISTANRFVVGNNCVLSGSDALVIGLTYTGVGIMFTSVSKSWRHKNLTLNCTTGTLWAISGSGTEIFISNDSTINVATWGTIGGMNGVQIDGIQHQVTAGGLTFSGANGVALIEDVLGSIDVGTLYDLGSATFDAISFDNNFATIAAGTFFLSGLASSGNINTGGLGTVHNSRFFGTGTALQTISTSDVQWQFFINDDIVDTHKDCLLSINGNATATVIAAVNTPTLIAGTWVISHANQFTGTTGGRMTYNGIKDTHFDITMSFSAEPVSGSNKTIAFYAALNGSVIVASEAKVVISSGTPLRITVIWRVSLSTGDYIEAFTENETDAIDILVSDAVLRVS